MEWTEISQTFKVSIDIEATKRPQQIQTKQITPLRNILASWEKGTQMRGEIE